MLRKIFSITIAASIVAVAAGIGWVGFVEVEKSEAAHADANFTLVNHQTQRMGHSLNDAGAFISSEIGVNIGQITDLSALLDEWSPKYQQARIAYRKFDAAILAAEDSADAYFAAQKALTEFLHSEELRVQARSDDAAEFGQYQLWRERAVVVQMEALEIVHHLTDMDTTLQKLKLRSDFSFDTEGFSEVPSDILALEAELAQFQIASDNIREAIGSPFDSKS